MDPGLPINNLALKLARESVQRVSNPFGTNERVTAILRKQVQCSGASPALMRAPSSR
jgi:hypothetical protein